MRTANVYFPLRLLAWQISTNLTIQFVDFYVTGYCQADRKETQIFNKIAF